MDSRATAPDSIGWSFIWTFGLAVATAVGIMVLGPRADWLLREGGPVETATVALLLFAAFLAIATRLQSASLPRWRVPVLLLLLAARELDFDKRFSDVGLLKLRLYTSEGLIGTKAIGLVLIALLAWIARGLIRDGYPALRGGLRNRAGWACCTLTGLIVVILAKSFDGLGRNLADFDIAASVETLRVGAAAEETLELAFAGLMVASVSAWMRRGR